MRESGQHHHERIRDTDSRATSSQGTPGEEVTEVLIVICASVSFFLLGYTVGLLHGAYVVRRRHEEENEARYGPNRPPRP